jgi:hypothetical protein
LDSYNDDPATEVAQVQHAYSRVKERLRQPNYLEPRDKLFSLSLGSSGQCSTGLARLRPRHATLQVARFALVQTTRSTVPTTTIAAGARLVPIVRLHQPGLWVRWPPTGHGPGKMRRS